MSKFDSYSHESTLYSSIHVYSFPSWICFVLVCSHDEESFWLWVKKYGCIVESWLIMIFDQANSFLEVITCSFKSLACRIPLSSCFGGHFVTHKSHHHHVMRSQTSIISLNPKLWSENTSPNFNIAYENPSQLLPLRKGVLPSLVMPTISWQ